MPGSGRHRKNENKALDIPWYINYTACMNARPRKRMGRPPLPKGTARELHVTVRLNAQELRRLKDEAKRRGVSVSELLMKPWREGD